MFDKMQLALETSGIQVDADFDSLLGFPSFFRIDNPMLGDDEFAYTVQSLAVVPEPSTLLLALMAVVSLSTHRRKSASHNRV